MICAKCLGIPFRDSSGNWVAQHHSTFAELDDSAKSGCKSCVMFRKVLLEYYAHHLSCSVEKAENYQRLIDQDTRGEEEDIEGGENREQEHLKLNPRSDGNSDLGSEQEEQNEEVEEYVFFVSPAHLEIDRDAIPIDKELQRLLHIRRCHGKYTTPPEGVVYPPIDEGLQGLLYVRSPHGENLRPLEDVWPFVEVSSLPGSTALREWKIVGRPVNATVDFSLAKDWIEHCAKCHELCRQPLETQLPTRVLDLGSPGDTSDLRLLVSDNKLGRYVTLSHCWGGSNPLKLTMTTFDKFLKKIAYLSLPKTFQDAVTATRLLGIRYLWIDSLCIIQDSKDDWAEQCTKMAQIYKDSLITIAGPAASGCNTGFLHTRPIPYQLRLEILDGKNSDDIVMSYQGINEDSVQLMPEPGSPLAKRAWVLQERLLSYRVLYFGSNRMYFECFTNVRFENCHYPIIWDFQSLDIVPKLVIEQLGTYSESFSYWLQLIQTYSGLLLSHPTDKLPALSGLASVFQRITKARYLVGIWQEDIYRELTWHVPWYERHDFPTTMSSQYIAPSWSWAAAKRLVTFNNQNYNHQFQSGLEILKFWVKLEGLDPFGAVKDGYVEVRGKLRGFVVRELPDVMIVSRTLLYLQPGESQSPKLAIYHPDDPSTVTKSEFGALMLYLGEFSGGSGAVVALGIEPIDGHHNEYRRVGFAYSNYRFENEGFENEGFKDSFEDTNQTTLRIL